MDCDCGAPEKEKGVGFVGPASLKCGERVLKARVLSVIRVGVRLTRLRREVTEVLIQIQYGSICAAKHQLPSWTCLS